MSEEAAALTEWERERNRHRVLLVWSGIVLVAILCLIFALVVWPTSNYFEKGRHLHNCTQDKDCDADRGFSCINSACHCILPEAKLEEKVVHDRCTLKTKQATYFHQHGDKGLFCGLKKWIAPNGLQYQTMFECDKVENRECIDSHCVCTEGYKESFETPFCYKELNDTAVPCKKDRDCYSPSVDRACINETCQKCTLGSFVDLRGGDFRCVLKFGDYCKRRTNVRDAAGLPQINVPLESVWLSADCGLERGMTCQEATTYDKRRIHLCGCTTPKETFDKGRDRCVARNNTT